MKAELAASDFDGKNLAQKLSMVASACGYIQKKGYNSHFKFKFVREVDLSDALRPLLGLAGIIMIPKVVHHEKAGTVSRVVYEFQITDGKESLTASAVGEGADAQDKGMAKATTMATKYVLMKLFLVSTGDDAENDADEEPPAPPRAKVDPGASLISIQRAVDLEALKSLWGVVMLLHTAGSIDAQAYAEMSKAKDARKAELSK